MSVRATFMADFSDFLGKVQAAEKELTGFETSTKRVSGELMRMGTSFSGADIARQAAGIVESVERIGGASKLTSSEQARVNATLTEAIEKYRVMGKDVPPEMVRMAEATKRVEEQTTAWSVAVGNLAAQLLTKAGAEVYEFGKVAVFTAAELESLRGVAEFMGQQAGYTATEINALAAALQRQGITSRQSYDTIIAMVKANLSLADATKLAGVAQSLARQQGENSSATLAKLIHGVQTLQSDVLRTAGATITLEQAYKAFADQSGRTVQSLTAQEKQQIALNAVIESGEKVAGVYGKTNEFVNGHIQSMSRHYEEAAAAVGKQFLPALRVSTDAATEALKVIKEYPGEFTYVAGSVTVLTGALVSFRSAAALGIISATQLATAMSALGPAAAVAATAFGSWKMGRWIGETAGLTDAVERLAGRMMGLSAADIEASMAARKYTESSEAKEEAQRREAAAVGSLTEKAIAHQAALFAEAAATAEATLAANRHGAAVEAAAAAAGTKTDRVKEATKAVEAATEGLKAYRSNLKFTAETIASDVVPEMDRLSAKAKKAAEDVGRVYTMDLASMPLPAQWQHASRDAMQQEIARIEALQAQFPGRRAGGSGATGVTSEAGWREMLAEQVLLEQLRKAVEGRAMGGPVEAGRPYIVGEQRPELFVPRQSGTILPSVPGGRGDTNVTVHVRGSVIAERDLARAIKEALAGDLRGGGLRWSAATTT